MKTLFLTPLLPLLIISCHKAPVENTFPNPTVAVHYIDKTGNNLFTNGANGFVKENVRIYTLINGEKSIDSTIDVYGKVVYNPYGWGNAYDSETDDSVFIAAVNLPVTKIDYKNDHYFTTIIDLKEGVEDTMRTYIKGAKTIDSLWYNGKLLYTNPYPSQIYLMQKIITIQKED